MSRERAFDHELLKQLVREHPEWSDDRYADILTEAKRRLDPAAPSVNVRTVESVIHRNRTAWEAAGAVIPNRWVTYSEFMPPGGSLPEATKNATELRYLRELAKEARGVEPDRDSALRLRMSALNWEIKLRESGQMLDLDGRGQVIYRYPTRSERGADGRPLAIAAWLLPGWREVVRKPLYCS